MKINVPVLMLPVLGWAALLPGFIIRYTDLWLAGCQQQDAGPPFSEWEGLTLCRVAINVSISIYEVSSPEARNGRWYGLEHFITEKMSVIDVGLELSLKVKLAYNLLCIKV